METSCQAGHAIWVFPSLSTVKADLGIRVYEEDYGRPHPARAAGFVSFAHSSTWMHIQELTETQAEGHLRPVDALGQIPVPVLAFHLAVMFS